MSNCIFCNLDLTKEENTLLEETKYFYILPSVGSLVDGYILIVSKKHINSMSLLNKEEQKEYQRLLIKYRDIFNKIYKKYPIIFEHGTPINNKKTSSSVIHAHTHIVNHTYKNEKEILEELNLKKETNLPKDKNYIHYISKDNQSYITTSFEPISQLMRIKIAKDLKLNEEYNWKISKQEKNITSTIENIKKYFKEKK